MQCFKVLRKIIFITTSYEIHSLEMESEYTPFKFYEQLTNNVFRKKMFTPLMECFIVLHLFDRICHLQHLHVLGIRYHLIVFKGKLIYYAFVPSFLRILSWNQTIL